VALAEARLQRQMALLARLRATGPLSTDYARWVDQTLYLLQELFGEGSQEVLAFQAAVGRRGVDDAFGLPVQGPWGSLERLRRGEAFLHQLLARRG